jgi:hypothetical protein
VADVQPVTVGSLQRHQGLSGVANSSLHTLDTIIIDVREERYGPNDLNNGLMR